MAETGWKDDYRRLVGGDPYQHGNQLKGINRRIGYRVKTALNAKAQKRADGRSNATIYVTGEVIQSYTPLCQGNLTRTNCGHEVEHPQGNLVGTPVQPE